MTSIISQLLLLIILAVTLVRPKPCDVLENLSCECHSSSNNDTEQLTCTNHYTPINTTIQLSKTSLQTPRVFDSFHLTFHTQEFNITPMFINQLSYLFPRSPAVGGKQHTIKIILTFQEYLQLHFEDYAFYQLFGDKSTYTSSLSLELTSSGQITFAPMAFHQLTVDQMSLHSSSLEPYSFEEIFNNTNIGSLSVEGCTPRTNQTLRRYFNGKIRSAKFTKMAEIVSSEEFPNYPVNSIIIEAHEPRKINASTFIQYHNLHGVHLVRPKFFFDKRSFDGFQYLNNLETIELDAETIKDYTFEHVTRIRSFTLGQNVRYLSEHSFDHLDYLTRLDLSKVILDQLYPSSKCILARYLQKQQKSNPAMIILPPQAEFCDCVYDFILSIINKKPDQSYMNLCRNTQQERCQLSECDVVKNFRVPYEKKPMHPQYVPSIDESLDDSPISLYPIQDRITTTTTTTPRVPVYVPRHPPVYHSPQTQHDDDPYGSSFAETQVIIIQPNQLPASSSPRSYFVDSHASFKANQPIDPNAIANDEDVHSPSTIYKSQSLTEVDDEHYRIAKRNKTFKWISLALVGITVVSAMLVGSIIWFFTCRAPKADNKAGFKRVPPSNSNV